MGKAAQFIPVIGPMFAAREQKKQMAAAESKAQAEQATYDAQMAAETEAKKKRLEGTAALSSTGASSRYGRSGSLLTSNTDMSSIFS